jgi:hypothetical protein
MVLVKKLIALLLVAFVVCGAVVGCNSPTTKAGGGAAPTTK